jgi:hypothetical protein
MPIGPFESEVLRLLASNRNPDSYVGGATVLHQAPDSSRASADIDVFHDTAPAVHDAAARDTETLQAAGYEVNERPVKGAAHVLFLASSRLCAFALNPLSLGEPALVALAGDGAYLSPHHARIAPRKHCPFRAGPKFGLPATNSVNGPNSPTRTSRWSSGVEPVVAWLGCIA